MRRIFKLRNLIFLAAAAGLAALLVSQQSVLDRNIERNKHWKMKFALQSRSLKSWKRKSLFWAATSMWNEKRAKILDM